MISPALLRIGEIVSETSNRNPSFRIHTVSRCATVVNGNSPAIPRDQQSMVCQAGNYTFSHHLGDWIFYLYTCLLIDNLEHSGKRRATSPIVLPSGQLARNLVQKGNLALGIRGD